MLQQWRAVSNIESDLTDPRFDSQIFCSRDERVTTPPIDQCNYTQYTFNRSLHNIHGFIGTNVSLVAAEIPKFQALIRKIVYGLAAPSPEQT